MNSMSKVYAEFESLDLADLACSRIKNVVPGIQRISITDRRLPQDFDRTSVAFVGQGVNNVQPYVTVISNEHNNVYGSAKVDIICDPLAVPSIKRHLISRGGLKVQELS